METSTFCLSDLCLYFAFTRELPRTNRSYMPDFCLRSVLDLFYPEMASENDVAVDLSEDDFILVTYGFVERMIKDALPAFDEHESEADFIIFGKDGNSKKFVAETSEESLQKKINDFLKPHGVFCKVRIIKKPGVMLAV